MNTLKSSGDSGCPCSVPISILKISDIFPLNFMRATEFLYMFSRTQKKFPRIPSLVNLYSRAVRQTESKAFLRSTKHAKSFPGFLERYLSIMVFSVKMWSFVCAVLAFLISTLQL